MTIEIYSFPVNWFPLKPHFTSESVYSKKRMCQYLKLLVTNSKMKHAVFVRSYYAIASLRTGIRFCVCLWLLSAVVLHFLKRHNVRER